MRDEYEVSAADIASYERDGVVCLRNVIPPAKCNRMLEATHEYLARGQGRINVAASEPGAPRMVAAVFMSKIDTEFRAFTHDSVLPTVAAQLMRVDSVRFFYDQLFLKEAGTRELTPWHNDLPFWPMRGSHLVSLWVALTRVTKESGAVEYLAESHKAGKLHQAVGPGGYTVPASAGQTPCPNYFDESLRGPDKRFLSWDMEPGDVLCHHPLTAHGARGNQTKSLLRVGLSVRYLGTDVQWDPKPGVMAIMPRPPNVEVGAYPADDDVFPLL